MLRIDNETIEKVKEIKNSQIWINEAEYALSNISLKLQQLSDNSNILEVGSGSGILLSFLKKTYPNLNFTGIEPLGADFITLQSFHTKLKNIGKNLSITSFENYKSDKRYEFIFLVNVFEHLDNWKDFFEFVNKYLKDNGTCLILCPNYAFPYETHFNIPILFNKKITYKFYKNYIDNFEETNNAHGLWNSLNFITYSKLIRFSKSNNLKLKAYNDISLNLVKRLDYDKEFNLRNPLLGKIAKLLKFIRVLNIIKFSLFRYIDPYIKVELSKN